MAQNLVQNSCKTSKMCSYVQEFFKNQYTLYLNKIEQNYLKNLTFPIFKKNVRPTVLISIFTTFLYLAWYEFWQNPEKNFDKHLHYLEEYCEELALK